MFERLITSTWNRLVAPGSRDRETGSRLDLGFQVIDEYPAVGVTWVTSYSYDGLDDLTGVNQSGQTRSFVYDSLKRLTSATNPETSATGAQSGTISYSYDANSNPTQ